MLPGVSCRDISLRDLQRRLFDIDDGMAAVALQDRFANNCHLDSLRQYYCGEVHEQNSTTLDRANLQEDDGLRRNSTRVSAQLVWDLDSFRIVSNTGMFDNRIEYGYDSTYQGGHVIAPTTVPDAPVMTAGKTERCELAASRATKCPNRPVSSELASIR